MRSVSLLIALLLLLVAGFGFMTFRQRRSLAPVKTSATTTEAPSPAAVSLLDPIRGQSTAAHTIIEFGDFACEACKAAESTLRELLETRDDVRLVWRDFPIENLNPFAKRAALAARCAQDQGKFWEYHDALLAEASLLSDAVLFRLVEETDINGERFNACLADGRRYAIVERNQQEALSLGSRGAPEFFINGVRYTGPHTVSGFLNVIARSETTKQSP